MLAEAQRFELWNPFGSPVFKTGAFNRSATLPTRRTINIPILHVKHEFVRSPEKQSISC